MSVREFSKIVALVVAAFAAALVLVPTASQAQRAERFWKPCQYEDSVNCVWDARHMGNGVGRSFVSIGDRRGVVRTVFLTHREAHRLLYR